MRFDDSFSVVNKFNAVYGKITRTNLRMSEFIHIISHVRTKNKIYNIYKKKKRRRRKEEERGRKKKKEKKEDHPKSLP